MEQQQPGSPPIYAQNSSTRRSHWSRLSRRPAGPVARPTSVAFRGIPVDGGRVSVEEKQQQPQLHLGNNASVKPEKLQGAEAGAFVKQQFHEVRRQLAPRQGMQRQQQQYRQQTCLQKAYLRRQKQLCQPQQQHLRHHLHISQGQKKQQEPHEQLHWLQLEGAQLGEGTVEQAMQPFPSEPDGRQQNKQQKHDRQRIGPPSSRQARRTPQQQPQVQGRPRHERLQQRPQQNQQRRRPQSQHQLRMLEQKQQLEIVRRDIEAMELTHQRQPRFMPKDEPYLYPAVEVVVQNEYFPKGELDPEAQTVQQDVDVQLPPLPQQQQQQQQLQLLLLQLPDEPPYPLSSESQHKGCRGPQPARQVQRMCGELPVYKWEERIDGAPQASALRTQIMLHEIEILRQKQEAELQKVWLGHGDQFAKLKKFQCEQGKVQPRLSRDQLAEQQKRHVQQGEELRHLHRLQTADIRLKQEMAMELLICRVKDMLGLPQPPKPPQLPRPKLPEYLRKVHASPMKDEDIHAVLQQQMLLNHEEETLLVEQEKERQKKIQAEKQLYRKRMAAAGHEVPQERPKRKPIKLEHASGFNQLQQLRFQADAEDGQQQQQQREEDQGPRKQKTIRDFNKLQLLQDRKLHKLRDHCRPDQGLQGPRESHLQDWLSLMQNRGKPANIRRIRPQRCASQEHIELPPQLTRTPQQLTVRKNDRNADLEEQRVHAAVSAKDLQWLPLPQLLRPPVDAATAQQQPYLNPQKSADSIREEQQHLTPLSHQKVLSKSTLDSQETLQRSHIQLLQRQHLHSLPPPALYQEQKTENTAETSRDHQCHAHHLVQSDNLLMEHRTCGQEHGEQRQPGAQSQHYRHHESGSGSEDVFAQFVATAHLQQPAPGLLLQAERGIVVQEVYTGERPQTKRSDSSIRSPTKPLRFPEERRTLQGTQRAEPLRIHQQDQQQRLLQQLNLSQTDPEQQPQQQHEPLHITSGWPQQQQQKQQHMYQLHREHQEFGEPRAVVYPSSSSMQTRDGLISGQRHLQSEGPTQLYPAAGPGGDLQVLQQQQQQQQHQKHAKSLITHQETLLNSTAPEGQQLLQQMRIEPEQKQELHNRNMYPVQQHFTQGQELSLHLQRGLNVQQLLHVQQLQKMQQQQMQQQQMQQQCFRLRQPLLQDQTWQPQHLGQAEQPCQERQTHLQECFTNLISMRRQPEVQQLPQIHEKPHLLERSVLQPTASAMQKHAQPNRLTQQQQMQQEELQLAQATQKSSHPTQEPVLSELQYLPQDGPTLQQQQQLQQQSLQREGLNLQDGLLPHVMLPEQQQRHQQQQYQQQHKYHHQQHHQQQHQQQQHLQLQQQLSESTVSQKQPPQPPQQQLHFGQGVRQQHWQQEQGKGQQEPSRHMQGLHQQQFGHRQHVLQVQCSAQLQQEHLLENHLQLQQLLQHQAPAGELQQIMGHEQAQLRRLLHQLAHSKPWQASQAQAHKQQERMPPTPHFPLQLQISQQLHRLRLFQQQRQTPQLTQTQHQMQLLLHLQYLHKMPLSQLPHQLQQPQQVGFLQQHHVSNCLQNLPSEYAAALQRQTQSIKQAFERLQQLQQQPKQPQQQARQQPEQLGNTESLHETGLMITGSPPPCAEEQKLSEVEVGRQQENWSQQETEYQQQKADMQNWLEMQQQQQRQSKQLQDLQEALSHGKAPDVMWRQARLLLRAQMQLHLEQLHHIHQQQRGALTKIHERQRNQVKQQQHQHLQRLGNTVLRIKLSWHHETVHKVLQKHQRMQLTALNDTQKKEERVLLQQQQQFELTAAADPQNRPDCQTQLRRAMRLLAQGPFVQCEEEGQQAPHEQQKKAQEQHQQQQQQQQHRRQLLQNPHCPEQEAKRSAAMDVLEQLQRTQREGELQQRQLQKQLKEQHQQQLALVQHTTEGGVLHSEEAGSTHQVFRSILGLMAHQEDLDAQKAELLELATAQLQAHTGIGTSSSSSNNTTNSSCNSYNNYCATNCSGNNTSGRSFSKSGSTSNIEGCSSDRGTTNGSSGIPIGNNGNSGTAGSNGSSTGISTGSQQTNRSNNADMPSSSTNSSGCSSKDRGIELGATPNSEEAQKRNSQSCLSSVRSSAYCFTAPRAAGAALADVAEAAAAAIATGASRYAEAVERSGRSSEQGLERPSGSDMFSKRDADRRALALRVARLLQQSDACFALPKVDTRPFSALLKYIVPAAEQAEALRELQRQQQLHTELLSSLRRITAKTEQLLLQHPELLVEVASLRQNTQDRDLQELARFSSVDAKSAVLCLARDTLVAFPAAKTEDHLRSSLQEVSGAGADGPAAEQPETNNCLPRGLETPLSLFSSASETLRLGSLQRVPPPSPANRLSPPPEGVSPGQPYLAPLHAQQPLGFEDTETEDAHTHSSSSDVAFGFPFPHSSALHAQQQEHLELLVGPPFSTPSAGVMDAPWTHLEDLGGALGACAVPNNRPLCLIPAANRLYACRQVSRMERHYVVQQQERLLLLHHLEHGGRQPPAKPARPPPRQRGRRRRGTRGGAARAAAAAAAAGAAAAAAAAVAAVAQQEPSSNSNPTQSNPDALVGVHDGLVGLPSGTAACRQVQTGDQQTNAVRDSEVAAAAAAAAAVAAAVRIGNVRRDLQHKMPFSWPGGPGGREVTVVDWGSPRDRCWGRVDGPEMFATEMPFPSRLLVGSEVSVDPVAAAAGAAAASVAAAGAASVSSAADDVASGTDEGLIESSFREGDGKRQEGGPDGELHFLKALRDFLMRPLPHSSALFGCYGMLGKTSLGKGVPIETGSSQESADTPGDTRASSAPDGPLVPLLPADEPCMHQRDPQKQQQQLDEYEEEERQESRAEKSTRASPRDPSGASYCSGVNSNETRQDKQTFFGKFQAFPLATDSIPANTSDYLFELTNPQDAAALGTPENGSNTRAETVGGPQAEGASAAAAVPAAAAVGRAFAPPPTASPILSTLAQSKKAAPPGRKRASIEDAEEEFGRPPGSKRIRGPTG
ncbi:hypothetical protein, conserved [Eimeria maxima]|uniref:Uncharacterized protein n=1 Tax=Eimeria maxima TaxID=5804 RepID=U6M8H0_EIMMA|nr:hypothetical protein, conserved [Eimeria maxima]CDJ60321.1 hypothetical protein, conserved [Eimeria maxima]